MAQKLYHQPLKLKVGDEVWFLKTTNAVHPPVQTNGPQAMNSSSVFRPACYRVIKIVQSIMDNNGNGLGGPRKRKFSYELVPTCTDSSAPSQIITADHNDRLFDSFESLVAYVNEEIKDWKEQHKRHMDRFDAIEETLHISGGS